MNKTGKNCRDRGETKSYRALGIEDDPNGDELTVQEAMDEIEAMWRKSGRQCFPPTDSPKNQRNAGRVRTLAQVLTVLKRAGLEPTSHMVGELEREEIDE